MCDTSLHGPSHFVTRANRLCKESFLAFVILDLSIALGFALLVERAGNIKGSLGPVAAPKVIVGSSPAAIDRVGIRKLVAFVTNKGWSGGLQVAFMAFLAKDGGDIRR